MSSINYFFHCEHRLRVTVRTLTTMLQKHLLVKANARDRDESFKLSDFISFTSISSATNTATAPMARMKDLSVVS